MKTATLCKRNLTSPATEIEWHSVTDDEANRLATLRMAPGFFWLIEEESASEEKPENVL